MALFALGKFLWCAFEDDVSALCASLGAEVDDVVGTLYDLHIMLHNHNGVPCLNQRIKGLEQAVDVVNM